MKIRLAWPWFEHAYGVGGEPRLDCCGVYQNLRCWHTSAATLRPCHLNVAAILLPSPSVVHRIIMSSLERPSRRTIRDVGGRPTTCLTDADSSWMHWPPPTDRPPSRSLSARPDQKIRLMTCIHRSPFLSGWWHRLVWARDRWSTESVCVTSSKQIQHVYHRSSVASRSAWSCTMWHAT